MFKKQIKYDDSEIKRRLKKIESDLNYPTRDRDSYYYYLDRISEPSTAIESLQKENGKLRLELKALEWRLRKLEDR